MKKMLVLTIILSIMLTLTACGRQNETNSITETSNTPTSATGAVNQTLVAPLNNNDATIDSPLTGTWFCQEYESHGNAVYYWSFGEDGRFAYLFSGYEPPHGGGDIESSVRERFMQGRFRVNGNMIECYDVKTDDFFSWGDNWRYFPERDPSLFTDTLLTTPLVESEATGDFTIDFTVVNTVTLHLEIDLGTFPDQYEMDFTFFTTK